MFSERMNTELVQQFWAAMQQGVFITDAAEQVGTYRKMGARWLAATGGIRPRRGRDLKGRCLSFREREEIALSRSAGESMRSGCRHRYGRSTRRRPGRSAAGTGARKCALPHRGPGRIHSSQQRGIQIVDAPAASGVAGHIRPARPSRLPQAPTPAQASSHHAHPHPPPVRFVTPGQQSVRLSFAATMTSNSYRNRERPAAISWPPE